MTTYTWNILRLLTLPLVDAFPDVVVRVQWQLAGAEDRYSGFEIGWAQFAVRQGEQFTPFNELTEAQVIGWVQNQLGNEAISDIETRIQQRINAQKNAPPTPEQQPLPWN